MQRLLRDDCIKNFEFDISDRLFTQRTFTSSPLEALNDSIASAIQQCFINFRRQSVIH